MQTQQNNYFPTFTTYVKPSPQSTLASALRTTTWSALILLAFFALQAFISAIMGQFHDYLVQVLFNGELLSTLILQFIFASALPLYILIHIEKQREQKRQLAAHGAEHLLSDWQPCPATSDITLPLLVQYKISKKEKVAQWLCILILCFIVPLTLLLIPPLHSLHSYKIVSICSGFVIMGIFLVTLKLRPKNIRLLANETGLSLYNGETRLQHIPWYDARLFSIVETAKQAHYGMPHTFELASAQEIIRWSAQNKYAWHEENGTSTLLSPDAYISYTRKLHSIITTNTALPLYDLRK
jgi:hypothetical protein